MTAKGKENNCYIYILQMLSRIESLCQTVPSLETSSAKAGTSQSYYILLRGGREWANVKIATTRPQNTAQ